MDAMARGDVDAVSACWRRTPCGRCRRWATWYRGRDEIAVFLATAPLNGDWRWRHLPARASGQAAVGSYVWDARDGSLSVRSRSTC